MYSQKTDEPLGNDEQFFNRVLRDLSGGSYVHDVAPLSEYTNMSIGERSEALDFMGVKSPFLKASALRNYSAWVSAHQGATAYGATMFGGSPYFTGRGGAIVDDDLIRSTLSRKLDSGTDTTTPTYIPGFGGNGDGSDISGFGRDRKALTINFNAPIVDWDSNITTGDPQDVVNEVSETIEGAASRAIQIALLGASQKMTTRF